jgi:hypothetical protein
MVDTKHMKSLGETYLVRTFGVFSSGTLEGGVLCSAIRGLVFHLSLILGLDFFYFLLQRIVEHHQLDYFILFFFPFKTLVEEYMNNTSSLGRFTII